MMGTIENLCEIELLKRENAELLARAEKAEKNYRSNVEYCNQIQKDFIEINDKLEAELVRYKEAEKEGRLLPEGFKCLNTNSKNEIWIQHPPERNIEPVMNVRDLQDRAVAEAALGKEQEE